MGEIRELALQIGVGAMKYGDLSNIVSKDYVFDLDKFSSFEGKTGPYIQYTGARINSLLEKANENGGEISVSLPEERNIVLSMLKMFDSLTSCYQDNSMNALALSVYNLASSYAQFYNNVKVLKEPDDAKRKSYISLSKAVLKAISLGLDTLGIETPKRM